MISGYWKASMAGQLIKPILQKNSHGLRLVFRRKKHLDLGVIIILPGCRSDEKKNKVW